MHSLALILVIAYLLGSIPFGLLLIRMFRGEDVRSHGSGNIGTANVLRTGGKKLGIATLALEMGKGVAAVLVASALSGAHEDAMVLAALAVILGHVFPVWLRFRGGKGVATAFGAFLVLSPWSALACFGLFIIVAALSRYSSLASMTGTVFFPILSLVILQQPHSVLYRVVICCCSALIIIRHRKNIDRLIHGTELQFGKKKASAA